MIDTKERKSTRVVLLSRHLFSMRSTLLFLLCLASQLSESYKFLGFSPQWAVSHVNYLGKIADALVDAGHEVVFMSCKLFDYFLYAE